MLDGELWPSSAILEGVTFSSRGSWHLMCRGLGNLGALETGYFGVQGTLAMDGCDILSARTRLGNGIRN